MPPRANPPKITPLILLAVLGVLVALPGFTDAYHIAVFVLVVVLALWAYCAGVDQDRDAANVHIKLDKANTKLDGLVAERKIEEVYVAGEAAAPNKPAPPTVREEDEEEPPPPPPPAPVKPNPPSPQRISLDDYGEALKRADEAQGNSYAERLVAAENPPQSFKEQVMRISHLLKILLKEYHGSFDVDSFISPEISKAIKPRNIVAVKNEMRKVLVRDPFSDYTALPITVSRMARLADEFRHAAVNVPEALPPLVFDE